MCHFELFFFFLACLAHVYKYLCEYAVYLSTEIGLLFICVELLKLTFDTICRALQKGLGDFSIFRVPKKKKRLALASDVREG